MKFPKFIRQAFKSLVKSDSSAYPQGQAGYNGKPTDFIRLSVYGVFGNAPKGSHVLLLGSQGQEAVKFGIENDFLNRLKGLKPGEVALYNTITKDYLFLKESGIEVKSSLIKLIGNVEIEGTSVKHNGKEIGENHGHTQANDSDGDVEEPISGVT